MTVYEPNYPLLKDLVDLVFGDLPPDRAKLVRFAVANDVLQHLVRDFKRPPVPARSDELDIADAEIVNKVRQVNHSSRPTTDEVAWGEHFGEWRFQVMRAEAEGAARVEVLFDAARTFTSLGCEEQAGKVLAFLASEWGAKVTSIPTYAEARVAAPRIARRAEALPRLVMEA